MSDEIIYTNSQVEKVRDKIKNDIFKSILLKVSDVRTFGKIIKNAYHIEGHSSQFAEDKYVYPVIYIKSSSIIGNFAFYVVDPSNQNKIIKLTDDDTLIVKYIDLETL